MPVLKFIHTNAPKVYTLGERGCACAYAMSELWGVHSLVLGFSIVLVAGILVMLIDRFIVSIGY
jgi:hypothetical protein